jgi:hypothetical protein
MAELPTKTWAFDGVTYKTTVMVATESRGLYFRFLQAMAPALEKLGDLRDAKDPEAAMAKVLAAVLGTVDVALFEDLCTAMCLHTVMPRANGEDSLAGERGGLHFAGKHTRLLKCVAEFMKANDFLGFLNEISALGLAESVTLKLA